MTGYVHTARRLKAWIQGLCVLLSMVSASLLADDSVELPQTITVQQLLEITRDKSPRFAALRQRIEAANADVVSAGVLPNPRISYGRYDLLTRQNTMYDGDVQQQVTLEVPVLVAGQRGARVEAAEKYRDVAAADIDTEIAELLREALGVFVKQLADRKRVAVLEETAQYMKHVVDIVSGRAQAGNASRYDLLRIEMETKALQTRLETLNNDLAASAAEFGVLLGLSGWTPQVDGDLDFIDVPTDIEQLWNEALHLNPQLESARRGEVAADASMERAERERWPVPTLQIGSVFTDRPYGNTSFAGVAVDLPIFDRGQGAIARAQAEKQAAVLSRNLANAQTRGALERAVEQLKKRRATRLTFEQAVMGNLQNLKDMGEASYRLGKGSLLELLDASRSRTETALTHLDLLQAEIEAELDILKLTGLLGEAINNSIEIPKTH